MASNLHVTLKRRNAKDEDTLLPKTTWSQVLNKPSTFTATSHSHSASEITSGVLADVRIPSLAISKTTGLQTALDGKAASSHSHTFASLTSKPTTLSGYGITDAAVLGETVSTAYRGDRGKIAYDHSQVAHAPSNAQKNSNITKAEIEAKLTGEITSHSHALPTHTHTKSQITDFPTSMPPTAHSTDLLTSGTLGIARGGTGRTDGHAVGVVETRASVLTKIWTGTQAQYDAIGTKDTATLYFITG